MIKSRNEVYSRLMLQGLSLRAWARKNDFPQGGLTHAMGWVGNTGEPKGKTADIIHKLEQTLNTEIYKRPNYTGEKVG